MWNNGTEGRDMERAGGIRRGFEKEDSVFLLGVVDISMYL